MRVNRFVASCAAVLAVALTVPPAAASSVGPTSRVGSHTHAAAGSVVQPTVSGSEVSEDGAADTAVPKRKVDAATRLKVSRKLKRLGFKSIEVSTADTPYVRNFLCAWREISGSKPHRGKLTSGEAEAILSARSLPRAGKDMVNGLNVNLRCQSTYWVQGGQFVKVFRVSTGGIGSLRTSTGTFSISRRIDGLHNSTSYPSSSGWNMYRPAYFTSWGEAFHGSPSDSLVMWYPATHGCVRMLQRDIDYLWRNGANAVGSKVRVYGQWQG